MRAIRREPMFAVAERQAADRAAPARRGLLIALEGGEGAGKTTQARLLSIWLRDQGYDVVTTQEPGGTKVGMRMRAMLLDTAHAGLDPRAEALMYAADRAEHVDLGHQARAGPRHDRRHRPLRGLLAGLPGGRPVPAARRGDQDQPVGDRRPDPGPDHPARPAPGRGPRPAGQIRRPAGGRARGVPQPGPGRLPPARRRRARALPGARRDPASRRDQPRDPAAGPRTAAGSGAAVGGGGDQYLPGHHRAGPGQRGPRARGAAAGTTRRDWPRRTARPDWRRVRSARTDWRRARTTRRDRPGEAATGAARLRTASPGGWAAAGDRGGRVRASRAGARPGPARSMCDYLPSGGGDVSSTTPRTRGRAAGDG